MATDKLTILMVDDDPEDVAIVRGMLERVPVWSVDLIACLDVASAAQQAQRRRPDVILLDFNFGGPSGLDVLASVRAEGFDGPIILLSGCGNVDVASMVLAGLSDFLSKNTLSSLTLYHAIALAIEKQKLPNQRTARATFSFGVNSMDQRPIAPSASASPARYQ